MSHGSDFDDLMDDTLHFVKNSTVMPESFKGSVQGKKIHVMGLEVDFDEGDVLAREMSENSYQYFEITTADFHKGLGLDNWELEVMKTDIFGQSAKKNLEQANGLTTNISISGSNVQIGDGNIQQIGESIQQLVDGIKESDFSVDEKNSTVEALKKWIGMPAVSAVLGAVASSIQF